MGYDFNDRRWDDRYQEQLIAAMRRKLEEYQKRNGTYHHRRAMWERQVENLPVVFQPKLRGMMVNLTIRRHDWSAFSSEVPLPRTYMGVQR